MMGHFLNFFSNNHVRGLLLPACILSAGVASAVACGSSDQPANSGVLPERTKPSTKTVTVNVTFPDGVQDTTHSLHVWFLEKDDAGANCADLVGGATDPNAGPIGHLGDFVTTDVGSPIVAKDVQNANGTLVYVEAVDDNGQVAWAGCVPLSKTSANVTLDKARVYDCAADGVRDGAPCDDGDSCNIGESCKNGACQGGKHKDCSNLDDSCNVGQCDADKGCVKAAYNDGATCDDSDQCTTGDKCEAGECVGTPRDCNAERGGCMTGSTCEPNFGCTTGTYKTYGTPCDDGKFCTTGDQCDGFGSCNGSPMDCGGGCATCSETSHGCTAPQPSGYPCNDSNPCTSSDQCDGAGKCAGKPIDCSSYGTADGCQIGYCDPSFSGCTSRYAPSGTQCGAPCKVGGVCDGTGYCSFTSYAVSGTLCDDKNPCTTGDYCDGGGYCTYSTYATSGTICSLPSCTNTGTCSFSTCSCF
jgi:hypothetical protein